MPRAAPYVTSRPAQALILIVRGVFLRGAGWEALAPQIITLGVIGVSVLAFATTRSTNDRLTDDQQPHVPPKPSGSVGTPRGTICAVHPRR